MTTRITTALAALEAQHGIRILYACESGSRAWGFPSPDSDYDVCFLHVHALDWCLGLDDGPDTLNFPVDDELDLGGWELRKTLHLLRGSNAALFEWLQSPIVYYEAPAFREQLAPLLPLAFNLKAGLHHYLGQLRRGIEEELTSEEVGLKRLFYALRSALAACWICERHTLPPMEFGLLRAVVPEALQGTIDELLAQKALSNEKTTVALPTVLKDFLVAAYAAGQAAREQPLAARGPKLDQPLAEVLRVWIEPRA